MSLHRLRRILIVFSAAIWTFSLVSCTTFQDIEYKGIHGFQFDRDGKEKGFLLTISVFNPNPYGFKIENTEAEISLNGKTIGRAVQRNQVELKSKEQTEVTCFLKTSPAEMLQLIPSLVKITFGGHPIPLEIKGSTVASKLFFSKKFNFSSKEDIDRNALRDLF